MMKRTTRSINRNGNNLARKSVIVPKQIAVLLLSALAQHFTWADTISSSAVSMSPLNTNNASNDDFDHFDATLLSEKGPAIDVQRFIHGNYVPPGIYHAEIVVNQIWIGRRNLELRTTADNKQTFACITKELLGQFSIDYNTLSASSNALLAANPDCINLTELIPNATAVFDSGDQRLEVSIPQAFSLHNPRGFVDAQYWDEGITAGFLSYNANLYGSSNNGIENKQFFSNFNLGFNIDGWRLRSSSSYLAQNNGNNSATQTHFQNIETYAQHDVTGLKSQLTIGQYYSPNDIFNSVSYTGVQLASDDRMLPEALRGYSPVIRGVADTNARVTVRQSGNVVYETSVAPGQFEIADMYSTGYAGDYQVTIYEADGRQKQFIVPYSSVTQLLRPGSYRYSAIVGKLNNNALTDTPTFAQATLQRGLSQNMTGYGGLIAANNYAEVQLGLAFSTPIGAIAADVTQSVVTDLPNLPTQRGQSYRISYSNLVAATKTNFSLAAYQYSTQHYFNLADEAQFRNQIAGTSNGILERPESRLQISINQPLGQTGRSVFVSGSAQNYWNSTAKDINYQAGLTTPFYWGGNLTLSVGRTSNLLGAYDTQFSLGLSIPFGQITHPTLISSTINHSDANGNNAQIGLSGTEGDYSQFSYNAFATETANTNPVNRSSRSNTVGAGAQYTSASGQLSASASAGNGHHQYSTGISGAVVAHSGGLILSPTLGETIGIIQANDANGAEVINSPGESINQSGYAIATSLTPYTRNTINLDTRNTDLNVELESTSEQAIPRAGAIVLIKFPTSKGRPVLMHLEHADNLEIPLGASVLNEQNQEIGMVAQGDRVFSRHLNDQGQLTIKWGDSSAQQCRATYQLPKLAEPANKQPYEQIALLCTTDSTVGSN